MVGIWVEGGRWGRLRLCRTDAKAVLLRFSKRFRGFYRVTTPQDPLIEPLFPLLPETRCHTPETGVCSRAGGPEDSRTRRPEGRLLRLPGLACLDETTQESTYPHDLRRHPAIIRCGQRTEITGEFQLRLQFRQ